MPQAAAEGFQLPALVTITCPGLQLLPTATAHGVRGDMGHQQGDVQPTEAHPGEQLCPNLLPGMHKEALDTP